MLLLVAQQYYMRRKQDADCVVGEKWKDPVARMENCACDDEDYEWCVCCLFLFDSAQSMRRG